MVDVQKIKIVSILRPVNLPPSRAHLVVYEPSYKKDLPVPTLYNVSIPPIILYYFPLNILD